MSRHRHFLSSCGENEFQEKISVLKKLKTEWQCSQMTNEINLDNTPAKGQSETNIPYTSEENLSDFKHEAVKMKTTNYQNSKSIVESEMILESPSETKHDTTVNETNSPPSLENELQNPEILDLMDNIKLETVKCRRGRPKGTKQTFWNFSKKSTSNNKRKATEQIQDSNKKQKLKECEKKY